MPPSSQSWDEHRLWVVKTLEDTKTNTEKLLTRVSNLERKAAVWGAGGGLVLSLILKMVFKV